MTVNYAALWWVTIGILFHFLFQFHTLLIMNSNTTTYLCHVCSEPYSISHKCPWSSFLMFHKGLLIIKGKILPIEDALNELWLAKVNYNEHFIPDNKSTINVHQLNKKMSKEMLNE